MRVTVLGGTGYAGRHIVEVAADHEHEVVSYSRSVPEHPIDGVSYVTESILNEDNRREAVLRSDVIISALSTRGGLGGGLSALITEFGLVSAAEGVRFGVIGSFSDLRLSGDGPRISDGEMPVQHAAEAATMAGILQNLLTSPPKNLDWFYVSPAADFGPRNPGKHFGTYRIGGEVALFDEQGRSYISGMDFGLAVVSEIERPTAHRAQLSFAY